MRLRSSASALALVFVFAFGLAGRAQEWKQIGPDPIAGESFSNLPNATSSGVVDGIALDPSGSKDSTIYIATAAGGVWKTTDGGANWSSKNRSMDVLYMGAIALDPSDPTKVYAANGGPYCCAVGGGIYSSTDGAEDWTLINPQGIFTANPVNAIVLPKSGTLLAATPHGLYKSVDSGNHFGNNDPNYDNGQPIPIVTPQGTLTNGNISDLKLDTFNPTTVYVAINNVGLFQSTDLGTTFPASGKLFGSANFSFFSQYSDVFIKFAQSTQPNNKTFYAFLCVGQPFLGSAKTGEPCALLKSTNLGSSWQRVTLLTIARKQNGQAKVWSFSVNQQDYDQIVAVDPQNANGLYLGLRQLYYVPGGGSSPINPATTQIDVNGAHTDDHAIAFSPPSHFTGPPTRAYVGNDGGFVSTAASGSQPGAQWQFLNKGLATALLKRIDIGRGGQDANRYTWGGMQDNGVAARLPGLAGAEWKLQCCGDTSVIAVDPKNPKNVIGSNDGQIWCSTSACKNLSSIGDVAFDPSGGVAYVTSANTLFQSKDSGANFASIRTFAQPINAIAQIKGQPNLMWLGMGDGTLRTSTDVLKGSTAKWSSVTVTGAPSGRGVAGLAIDPADPSAVVVVYGGLSSTAPPQNAYRTADGGKTWSNIGGAGITSLPGLPLFSVVILPTTTPSTIIVGSYNSVLQSSNNGQSWQVLGTGFPAAEATSLALDYSSDGFVLRASTFGRSAWELGPPPPPPTIVPPTEPSCGPGETFCTKFSPPRCVPHDACLLQAPSPGG